MSDQQSLLKSLLGRLADRRHACRVDEAEAGVLGASWPARPRRRRSAAC